MIDFDGVDGPERFSESAGVVSDEVGAGGGFGGAGAGGPDVAGPVAAEGRVENLELGISKVILFAAEVSGVED